MNVTEKNRDKIFINLYGYKHNEDREPSLVDLKLKPGEFVRLSKIKIYLKKALQIIGPKKSLLQIKLFLKINQFTLLKIKTKKLFRGVFYEKELQKVYKKSENIYRIEKIIKTRYINKKIQYELLCNFTQ